MQLIGEQFVYSATDLNDYLECTHLTALERLVARKLLRRPDRDPTADLLARKGDEHERRHLEKWQYEFGDGLVAFSERPENTRAGLADGEARTVAAMARGARVIYQATFFDGTFVGHADFLRRVEAPSRAWPWSYEVIDAKLARSAKPYFLIQLCNYSEHLTRIQGNEPRHAYVILGSGDEQRFRVRDYAAYYRRLKASFLGNVEQLGDPYPFECTHCAICEWRPRCEAQRDGDDHLSIVAFMRGDQIEKLNAAGITTLTALAEAGDSARPRGMLERTFANLRAQAGQQLLQRRAHAAGDDGQKYFWKLRPLYDEDVVEGEEAPKPAGGFAKLPRPDRGDVYFDIEGDPLYHPEHGLEYLFGVYIPEEDRYVRFWARGEAHERLAFEDLVDFIVERRARFPSMHVYHYASYEKTALRRLMGRYATREREIDAFLREGVLVDLYDVVRQGLWISQQSYSLKKLEAFYGMERTAATRHGDDSIVMFEAWLASGDDAILADIERYNEEDCRSTDLLHRWLLERREELGGALEWRAPPEDIKDKDDPERSELEHALLDGLPEPTSLGELRAAADSVRARWLLGNLLRYHRREAKPEWWEYFDRCADPSELDEFDRHAIGKLTLRRDVTPYKHSEHDRTLVYAYDFPVQDHDFHAGSKPVCPDTEKTAGTIIEIDDRAGSLRIKLSGKLQPAALRALIPPEPLRDVNKRVAMEALARAYLDRTLANDYPATLDLLLNRIPRLHGGEGRIQPADVTKGAVSSAVARLERSYLFIQGPPGSGKSTIGASAIVDLLAAGKRVGIAAHSHKALHNLLRKIEETARERAFSFIGAHKETAAAPESSYVSLADWPMVRSIADSSAFGAEFALLSATTFAWADPKAANGLDYMVVDEAGQVPLADALIASSKACNTVVLGDPLQLPHVSKGSHPVGGSLSILEHLLGDELTVPEDRGIFLDRSYRLPPPIAEFVASTIYERAFARETCAASNRVDSRGLCGSGLRFLGVEHSGNGRHSPEEVERIVAEIATLLDGTVALGDQPARAVTQDDIKIVTPYNAQRRKLEEALERAGCGAVRVGTVDKFQGQEAPVVFYSMATSSDEDMPRDTAFLFSKNRFNVAISRAQCLTVLVCSPRLLDSRCRTPEQMALVNLLCAFAEAAERTEPLALVATI